VDIYPVQSTPIIANRSRDFARQVCDCDYPRCKRALSKPISHTAGRWGRCGRCSVSAHVLVQVNVSARRCHKTWQL